MKEPEFRKLVRKELIKLSEGLNKKDVSYQLSIDYSGNTKPKVTKLNKKGITIFYGYKTNPKDVIKSLKKLDPTLKLKHTGWSNISSGGGAHSFVFESKLDESGILYKAGVKKYGKEGMEKIQSAAGKGEGHEEIGKIKDKFEKGKTNEVEEISEANPFANTKGLKPLLKFGTIVTKNVGEKALLQFSDKFEDLDTEDADDIASHLNMAIELMQDGDKGAATKMLKQFNKKCKDVLKGKSVGSVFEGKLTEVKIGDMVKIDKAYGGGKGKVEDKKGSFVVVNGSSYHETDVKVVNESNLTEAKEDYKYKKQVGKAFDKINDEMFNFRHAFGIKQLTNDDMKLKKKFEALQANIFALQREMRKDGLSEGSITEAKLRAGDIIKMQDGEYGVVNKLKGKVAYIKLQSNPGSFHPIEADRATYKGKHKGKDLYNESVPAGHHKMPNGEIMADEDHVDEANRGKVFRAAKKGSYPVTLVAIDNGKVVHQELARTPEIVPAAFNVLQVIIKKKYPNAKIRVEDNTGKLLFVEGKLNEMEMNDPLLIAIRARKQDIAKAKSAPKTKKISIAQYYKLMDAESDLISQIKAAAKDYEQLDSEMNQDAGQKGADWSDADANRYGGDLDKLQTKIEKLAKQKLAVKKAITNYRMS